MPKVGEKNYDVRLIEREIHQGKIKKSDYDKYVKSLPDDTDNALWVSLEEDVEALPS